MIGNTKEAYMNINLNNGIQLPAIGLGVLGRDEPQLVSSAVHTALRTGYKLIDTAASYGNERQVGEGIRQSGVRRSDIFITTKLWLTNYGYESALKACDVSLRKLGLEYVDLYLLHWPMPSNFKATVEAYRATEKLLADGKVRAIGVSNFSPAQLAMLMKSASVVPAVNQIELHPRFTQEKLRAAHAQLGVVTQSWSPLGGSIRRASKPDPLEDPAITVLSDKYHKTPAQIILRWHIDHGFSAIPKSFKAERIAENFDVFDFSLSPEDVRSIDAMDTGVRSGPNPEDVHRTTFPITIDD
jgi:diketogulonate reductase-like aldo/keto reductase